MRLREYLGDRGVAAGLKVLGFAGMMGVLYFIGVDPGILGALAVLWGLLSSGCGYYDYWQRRRYWQQLAGMARELEQKYLLAELMEQPQLHEYQGMYRCMKLAMKSMREEVAQSERRAQEYREFIDRWVHGVKVPVTSVKLMCENNRDDVTRKILYQMEQIETDIDKVMYFARSSNVEKDYLVKQIHLRDVVMNVLRKNKQFLILNNMMVDIGQLSGQVFSDPKWIEFMLNQMLINSVKYKDKEAPVIRLYTEVQGRQFVLNVEDNGMGILDSEVSRIFDKGFTGSNGRKQQNATGMGLYLCRELCRPLNIEMEADSKHGEYTRIRMIFPEGRAAVSELISEAAADRGTDG